ncbi:MAG: DUF805 domain-containing protein [Asticcacaulis sp.]
MDLSNWKTMLFTANGRIRRSEYWLWAILSMIALTIVFYILMMVLGVGKTMAETGTVPATLWILYIIYLVPVMWIGICLQVKRWHDRNKSGWMCLIGLIPIVGGIWAFIEVGCLDGTQGPNKYGPSPKGIGSATEVF